MNLRVAVIQDLTQIVALTEHLLGGTEKYRMDFLLWKYFSNPMNERVFAAVAVINDRIMGFRGLYVNQWENSAGSMNVAFYCDAVVHPDFRGQNVLAQLNDYVSDCFEIDYAVAFSSNEKSARVYTKQGAKVLFKTHVLRRFVLPLPIRKNYTELNWREMQNLLDVFGSGRSSELQNCLEMSVSETYYRWKLEEPNTHHVLICSRDEPKNYLLLRNYKRSVEIFDYNPNYSWKDIVKLVKNYCRTNGKLLIHFPLHNPKIDNLMDLKSLGFNANNLLKRAKKNLISEKEVLIRPFKNNFADDDFYWHKLDLREGDNWDLKQLYYL